MEAKPIKQYQVNPANNHLKHGSAPLIFSKKKKTRQTKHWCMWVAGKTPAELENCLERCGKRQKLAWLMWLCMALVCNTVLYGQKILTDSVKCHRARKAEHLHSNQKQYGQYGHPSCIISSSDYPLISSNMAGWKSPN